MEHIRERGTGNSQRSWWVREYAVRNGVLDVWGHVDMWAERGNCTEGVDVWAKDEMGCGWLPIVPAGPWSSLHLHIGRCLFNTRAYTGPSVVAKDPEVGKMDVVASR